MEGEKLQIRKKAVKERTLHSEVTESQRKQTECQHKSCTSICFGTCVENSVFTKNNSGKKPENRPGYT